MSNLLKYSAYSDSGIDWIGEIPSSWNTVLLSQVVSQVKNKNIDLQEKNLLSLSYGKIKRKPIDENGGLLPESFDGYNIIEENDIVLRLTDLQNDHRSLRVGISSERGIITSAYITMRPNNTQIAQYLYYLLHTFDIRKGFYGMGSGVRQGLNYDEVKKLKLPFPSEAEQIAIVDYLNNRLTQIDSVIAEAKASIEEYKSWKASIIYEAVTKGLVPNVEMKDSGVEWIGVIPEHWTVKRFKYAATVKSNLVDPDEYKIYPQVAPDNIEKGSGKLFPCKTVEESGVISGNHLFFKGQILYSKIRPLLNKATIAPFDGLCSADMYPIETIEDTQYILYSILSEYFLQQVALCVADRVKMPKINQEELSNIYLAIPPREEQLSIVEYILSKCKMIDSLIDEKNSLISDLEAYKKSLIYEVVTGKRKVC